VRRSLPRADGPSHSPFPRVPFPRGRTLTPRYDDATRDALVIGSGFGGALAAHALVRAGWRVTLLERGPWVPRGPENWLPESVGGLGPFFSTATGWHDLSGAAPRAVGTYHCVGGPSVFYGGVSLRFREADFAPEPEIDGDSGAAWPFGYAELEPWYGAAERIIGVAGTSGIDPTEPPRSMPFPAAPLPLAPVSERIAAAARALGFTPFPLPLAMQTGRADGRNTCIACGSCDGFACAIEAKNDLSTAVLRPLLAHGLDLRTGIAITQLEHDGRRITRAVGREVSTGASIAIGAPQVFLAAGAIGTPQLLLASGLAPLNPAADAVGRYLTRHKNEILLGIFPRKPDPDRTFHKQLGIHDFYFGDPAGKGDRGLRRAGGLQQLPTPPIALARDGMPGPLKGLAHLVPHLTGLLVIAEDQPRAENRVTLTGGVDEVGMARVGITHRYSARDIAAADLLRRHARRILRRAGAWGIYRHAIDTYSHALGTVRLGRDPRTAPLDGEHRFGGVENLFVVDGSALPRSAGVNPSLTIAALALRAASRLAARQPARASHEASYA
jgi:choline dehydrogenase-like flavoprotein